MSHPIFYVPAGDVLPIFFSTYDGGTGASITLTGLAVTDIEIYKDASTTQRASDAGYALTDTDGIDVDSVTGLHGFTIDTGDNTDAGFYTVGAWFTVVVASVTVDAQTVNFIAAQFRIMPAESVAGKPKVDVDAWLGTAAATPTVAGVPEVDLTHVAGVANSTTTAQLGVNVVSHTANSLTAAAINADAFTAAKFAADVTTEFQNGLATSASITSLDGKVDTIDNFLDTEIAAILAAVDTEVGAIKTVTDALGASAAARLQTAVLTELTGTIDSTAHAPTTTEFEADDITEATADHFNGRVIIFTSGALQYQATSISDYAIASGRGHFTVVALTEPPGNNDTFIIV